MTIEEFKADVCAAFPHVAPDDVAVDASSRTGASEYFCASVGTTGIEVVWLHRAQMWKLSGHSAVTLPGVMAMARTWALDEVTRLTRKAADLNGGKP